MKLTKRQAEMRLNPYYINKRWFYLGDGEGVEACSFHQSDGNNVFGIPASALLRALDKCGYLHQWDRERQALRKIDR